MGVLSLFGKNRRLTDTVAIGDQTFRYTIITEPNNLSPPGIKTEVHTFLDDACLGITPKDVSTNIRRSNYSAVCRVENTSHADAAIGTLQYAGWCSDRPTEAQLWLNDVCRLTSLPKADRPAISPVAVLMRLCEEFALRHGIADMWLFVEKEPAASATKLQEIYTAYGYTTVTATTATPSCESTDEDSYIMHKSLIAPAPTERLYRSRSRSTSTKSDASRRTTRSRRTHTS